MYDINYCNYLMKYSSIYQIVLHSFNLINMKFYNISARCLFFILVFSLGSCTRKSNAEPNIIPTTTNIDTLAKLLNIKHHSKKKDGVTREEIWFDEAGRRTIQKYFNSDATLQSQNNYFYTLGDQARVIHSCMIMKID